MRPVLQVELPLTRRNLHLLRFCQERRSQPVGLGGGKMTCVTGMDIGKGERVVQKRPFHATRLPGSQSSGCQRKTAALS